MFTLLQMMDQEGLLLNPYQTNIAIGVAASRQWVDFLFRNLIAHSLEENLAYQQFWVDFNLTVGCATWQLDTSSDTPNITQTGISCSEERSPLCLRPIDPASEITLEVSSFPQRRKNKGKGRRRNQVNKKRQSLRWKQRKNKKSEKVGFTKKRRKGRSVEARQAGQGWDPIEVSNFTEMVGRSGAWVYILPNARTVGPGKIRICLGKIRIFEVYS